MAKAILEISTSRPKTFEEILDILGGFGLFQFIVLLILLNADIPGALIGLLPIFIGRLPDYWICNGEIIGPKDAFACNGTLIGPTPYTTIVSEWFLIGSTSWASDLMTNIQMFGGLIATIFSSQFSDWYGRRIAMIGITVCFVCGAVIAAAAPNIYVFALGRFLVGSGSAGVQGLTSVYSLEFMPTKWRPLPATVRPYGEGTMLLGVLAYFFRPWRLLAWVTTISIAIFAILLPLVPESPRWLIQHNRLEEAKQALNRIAKINGRPPIDATVISELAISTKPASGNNKTSYATVLKDKDLRFTAIILMTLWFAWAVVYFGMLFNTKNIPGDRFLNVVYLGAADAVGFHFSLLVLNGLGRRASVIGSMSASALCLVVLAGILIWIPNVFETFPNLLLILYLTAKCALAVTRASLRCLTGESFPTTVRSVGSGLCGISLCVGTVISPQLVYLGMHQPSIPLFVFAIISVAASILALFVKETRGIALSDSVGRRLSRKLSEIMGTIVPPIIPGSRRGSIDNEKIPDKVNKV